jgi:hypothetical protein
MTYSLPPDLPIEVGGVPNPGGTPPKPKRRYALPVRYGTINQVFGPTNEPLDSGGFNKGVDIGVPVGTPVFSVTDGEVIAVGDHGDGWGTSVWIRDAEGYIHQYGHLSKAQVQVGDRISAGTQIALSGNTGASTGPHLSYDVRDASGRFVDPSRWLGFNAAGDNRSGHRAIGRDIRELAGDDDFVYSPPPRDGVEYVETNPPPSGWPRGYERYLASRQRWNQLFYKFAPWSLGDKGYAVTFDGDNVYGVITDPATGASRKTPQPIATADEWREFMLLTQQLTEYEDWLDSYYGPDAAEWYVKFADWVYQTSPEYIDYLNADRAFKERAQTVAEAANTASALYEGYRERQSKAIEQLELFRRDETIMTPVPDRILRSWQDFFDETFKKLSEAKGEPPKVPYYPEWVRGTAIERGTFMEPPPIPGQTAPPPQQPSQPPQQPSPPRRTAAGNAIGIFGNVTRALGGTYSDAAGTALENAVGIFRNVTRALGGGSRQPSTQQPQPKVTSTPERTPAPTPSPRATPAPSPSPTPTPTPTPSPASNKQNRLPPVPASTRRALDQGSGAAVAQMGNRPLATLARGAYGDAASMPAVRSTFLSLPTRQPQISTQLVMMLRQLRRQQNGLGV